MPTAVPRRAAPAACRADRPRGPSARGRWAALAALIALLGAPSLAAAQEAAEARRLLLSGRYAEARRAYERLAGRDPETAAIGAARSHAETGAWDEADRALRGLLAHRPSAAAHAELAALEFERGRHDSAARHVAEALRLDPEALRARWLEAELHRVAGRLDEADAAHLWLVRFYNREQERIRDPEALRWIGLAAAQYARWNRNSGQFHFLVNTLYPDAAAADSLYWPARLEAAALFIEKYNLDDAAEELDAGLRVNPHAAELHAARAAIAFQRFDLATARAALERALTIHPRLIAAHRLSADLEMVASGPRAALAPLERARALNPVDEETLGRLAAVTGAIDGMRDDPAGTRMGATLEAAVRRNPRCGSFFAALASSLDLLRKYPHAARWYEEARRRMPQLVHVPGQLGMVAMRLGEEERARGILRDAFEADPFNIRVENTLRVLEVLDGYHTRETDHFVLRFDPRDSLLARYAAAWLEDEVYPEVTRELGFAPPGKSLIEIFAAARGQSGHGWFSARMVGLPYIGTVGACAGKMVAITSPNDGRRFNWARVLKHEFVHVVNLQQTDFNIPRWYTEGLAVRLEGPGTPRPWDEVLARRAARDSLYDLDTIHFGFARPSSLDDWALAYCQAELYVRYLVEAHGADAPRRLIAAYAANLETPQALERALGVSRDAFETGYRAFLRRQVAATPVVEPPVAEDADALDRALERSPRDPALLARAARAHLEAGRPYRARELAERALAERPSEAGAAYVVARVRMLEGNAAAAREALRAAHDDGAPDRDVLALLVTLTLDARDYPEAERLASLGRQRFPGAGDWESALVVVLREAGRAEPLAELLARRAEREADDLGSRLELVRLALGRRDFAAAGRWAREAIHIDVRSAEAHAALARSHHEAGRHAPAIEEYQTAIALEPTAERTVELARALAAAGRRERARQVLAELLARDADHAEARALAETLK